MSPDFSTWPLLSLLLPAVSVLISPQFDMQWFLPLQLAARSSSHRVCQLRPTTLFLVLKLLLDICLPHGTVCIVAAGVAVLVAIFGKGHVLGVKRMAQALASLAQLNRKCVDGPRHLCYVSSSAI